MTASWPAKGRTNSWCSSASAYFCGSVTHTITSTIPVMRSAMSRWADSTESRSGRSSSTTPGVPASVRRARRPRAGLLAARASAVPSSRAWRSSTSSQSSSASLPASPSTAASGAEVVGRRTAARATSLPIRALSREDFPEPVAPNSPITVCSAERARRRSILSSSSVVPVRASPGAIPSSAESARSRASSRSCSGVVRGRRRLIGSPPGCRGRGRRAPRRRPRAPPRRRRRRARRAGRGRGRSARRPGRRADR